ncbi:CPBP family intramembrane glutamic endopeptidase [Arsukibacterium perlucidum]|uniref:CPBP family intramembrane glutamic endopeptidase n=1 Tax=Arsukibacterium perlucidum TaxID=368811 RepID=UPI00037E317C|nr:CPBP family intramembrane glutamic endopeptidase [Arsukibacterium perlucidum]
MKSDAYNAKQIPKPAGLLCIAALLVFLLMELPVRLWLQPDPWLLNAQHWYFNQPLRLAIELTLVMLLVAAVRWTNPNILRLERSQTKLLLGCMLASAMLFGSLEAEQLLSSFSAGLWLWLAWFATGFCIGIGQELLYRGLLFSSLNRFMSVTLAGVITTVAFVIAPLHSVRSWQYLQQEHFTVVAVLIAIYIGASTFFQWLRNHTGNVIAPALVHGVGNAITWVAVFA